jgi:Sulfotransferase domain
MKILLAGTHRSGSTWTSQVLSHARDTRVVSEPDGPISDVLGAVVASRLGEFPVLEPSQRSYWYRVVWDLAFSGGWPWDQVASARAAGRGLVRVPPGIRDRAVTALAEVTRRLRPRPGNVIVKSVNSAFSLEWIARRYAPTVVVLRRNPLNVVSSWLVLGMGTGESVSNDARVVDSYLRPLGLQVPNGHSSEITRVAFNVGLLTKALSETAGRHPEWIVASHDDLCIDPATTFRELTARIGLEWTDAMDGYLRHSDDPSYTVRDNPRAHPNAATATTNGSRREQQATQFKRRLTPDQTAEARAVLQSFDLGDWGPPPS